jgi:tRNA A37 threonylcarbamoyladenosine synthetase subunit TsaC/SUA5/YrdC
MTRQLCGAVRADLAATSAGHAGQSHEQQAAHYQRMVETGAFDLGERG